MLKKLISFVLILPFLFSIFPTALAEEGTTASSPITRMDIENALAEVAWDFYIKDNWIQYDSVDLNTRTDGNNNPLSRWYGGHTRLDNYLNTLEDANSDDTLYSVCSYLPWAVYYETLDYPLFGNSLNASTLNLWLYAETPDDMCVIRCHSWPENTYQSTSREEGYVTHEKCVSYEEMREFLSNWEENLRPGDIFYAISGHTALYVGNGWIIESQGKKYNMVTGVDTVEVGGSIKAWTIEDYFLNEASGSNYLLSRLLEDENKRICVLRPLDLLTVDDGDGNPGNDVLDEEYELQLGSLNLQFSADPNNILKTSGYTIQASAYSRLAYPAMNIDRTVNTTTYGTAVTGGTLTYSIAISNESNNPDYVAYRSYGTGSTYLGTNYENLCIIETVPENTTLIDAAGANIVGNSLTWVVDVPVGETVIVSYTVQVTGAIGEYIINDGGMVADIPSNSLTNKIGGAKLSNDALANMNEFYESGTDVWNSNDGYKISAGVTQGTRFAERIYNETVGIDLQLPEIQELVNILFAQTMVEEEHGMYLQNSNGSNSKYMYTLNDTTADSANQIYRDMLIDGYYGGVWVYSNSYAGEPRIDELRTDYLEPGDILLYLTLENSASNGQSLENRDVLQWQILVYLGNGNFASLNSSGKLKALENSQAVLPAFTYDIFFALRPSQVYANINIDVAAFSGSVADLTEEDAQQKYTPQISDIMLNEQLSANLATLTPNDGWTALHFNFVGEVYKHIGIDAPVAEYWENSYATHLKNLFADNLDSDSDACAIYQHEYTLLQEPDENSEKMFESLIYYDGPTMVINNPITSLEELHPGDVIMAGFRRERHYVYLIYQGQGNFLYAMSSLSGGAENLFAYGEPIYGQYSFETDAEFLGYLNGPIDETRSVLGFESYLILRPSRVYEDINQVHILRNIAENVLTDEEMNILASLTVADWQSSAETPKNNLNGAGNWMYKAAGIDTSSYLDITVDAMRKIIFQSVLNEAYNKKYYIPAEATEDTRKYHVMLVPDSWGGEYFAPNDQHPVSTALQIGDIFCGIYLDGNATVYWVGLYQGNGNFLVQQSHNQNGLDCFVRSCTEVNTKTWRLYYVLRPQNLATYCRNISTGTLTVTEKQRLANLSPEAWPGNFANLKKSSQWFYNAARVDVSTFITDNIASVKSNLFTGSNTNLVVKENNTSAYAAMLIDGYYGSRNGIKHSQFSAADFEIGDIFCAFGECNECGQSYYMTAVYQGNGTFLSIANCNTGETCVLSCDYDTTTVFATDFFAQTSAATWKYYFVLRPDQLNQST